MQQLTYITDDNTEYQPWLLFGTLGEYKAQW